MGNLFTVLTEADVGFGIGAGIDVAMDSTDVVMIESDLYEAVAAIEFSHATLRKCIRTYGGLVRGTTLVIER